MFDITKGSLPIAVACSLAWVLWMGASHYQAQVSDAIYLTERVTKLEERTTKVDEQLVTILEELKDRVIVLETKGA